MSANTRYVQMNMFHSTSTLSAEMTEKTQQVRLYSHLHMMDTNPLWFTGIRTSERGGCGWWHHLLETKIQWILSPRPGRRKRATERVAAVSRVSLCVYKTVTVNHKSKSSSVQQYSVLSAAVSPNYSSKSHTATVTRVFSLVLIRSFVR